MKRKAAERCAAIKDAMTTGVWANSNYDSQKEGQEGPRQQMIESIEEQYKEAMREIYMTDEERAALEKQEDDFWKNPFFAASKAPRIGYDEVLPDITKGDPEREAERKKLIDALDQS